jgi:hypothetical protein
MGEVFNHVNRSERRKYSDRKSMKGLSLSKRAEITSKNIEQGLKRHMLFCEEVKLIQDESRSSKMDGGSLADAGGDVI